MGRSSIVLILLKNRCCMMVQLICFWPRKWFHINLPTLYVTFSSPIRNVFRILSLNRTIFFFLFLTLLQVDVILLTFRQFSWWFLMILFVWLTPFILSRLYGRPMCHSSWIMCCFFSVFNTTFLYFFSCPVHHHLLKILQLWFFLIFQIYYDYHHCHRLLWTKFQDGCCNLF